METKRVLVVGAKGSGKSALIAQLTKRVATLKKTNLLENYEESKVGAKFCGKCKYNYKQFCWDNYSRFWNKAMENLAKKINLWKELVLIAMHLIWCTYNVCFSIAGRPCALQFLEAENNGVHFMSRTSVIMVVFDSKSYKSQQESTKFVKEIQNHQKGGNCDELPVNKNITIIMLLTVKSGPCSVIRWHKIKKRTCVIIFLLFLKDPFLIITL